MQESGGALPTDQVTLLLRAWSSGDSAAMHRLAPVLHTELKRIARRYMAKERKDHTLQPSALVNEAFLRLVDARGVRWQDRAHFYALAAQTMRRILVNYALARGAGKRGGSVRKVSLEDALVASPERDERIVELDAALEKLAGLDDRKARIVEMRYFAGLSVEETAAVLKVSPQTVLRDWSLAKSWLARELDRSV